MSVARYDSYRDTDFEWLGAIPSGWQTIALRYLADCCDGQRVPLNSTERADRPGDVPYWGANAIMGYVDQPIFDEELVLLGEDGAPFFDKTRPVAFRSVGPVWPNNHIHVLRPKPGVFAAFLTHALNATDFAPFIDGSTRDKLTQTSMMSIPIATPPAAEQCAIAAFLDRETGKIDALVEAQRQLIELLKEKWQAVISHAVTKGLDPTAPMKDSGVEWLGKVPAHWDIAAVWMLFSLGRGRVLSHQDIADNAGIYPVYSSQTESDGEMGFISTFDFEGDYLTWTTDGAHAGTVFRRSGRFNCTNVCGTLRPKGDIKLDFFQAALSQATGFFVRHDINPKLMNNVMSGIRLPVPPLEEQSSIAEYLSNQTKGFGCLAREAEAAIRLLQERRSALISSAVTGKIDVRALQDPAQILAKAG